jgi:colanic acid/amylovoran biosynthesis glycosyltransferase
MEKINICITSPFKDAYSETFIQNLTSMIEGNIYFCFGGLFPNESKDGELKNHFGAPLILKALSKLGLIRKPIKEIYLESYLKRNKIQLIIANYGPSGVELSEISYRLGIPLIVHFHGFDSSVNDIIQKYRLGYEKMFETAKAIIVVSNEMKNKVISLGANKENIFLLRCAPSTSFSKVNPDYYSDQLIAVGRFVGKKAPHLTLLAFIKAQEKCPDLKLKLIGAGELLQICKELSIAMKIKNIEFLGVLSPEQIAKEMSNSFCFIQHSKTASNGDKEGTPVAVMEAMAAGLPVVSTFHAGIPDVIKNNENGFLVEEGDVEEMANCIVKLYHNRNLAERFGVNNKKYIQSNLTQERYKNEWDTLIQKIVNGR